MNKFFPALVALCLLDTASLTFAMEPMDKSGAMEKDAMKMEPMKKEGAMTKAAPMKMKKQNDKMDQMEQGGKMEHGSSMSMDPKK